MLLYPAIDVYNGKVVRLSRGDYADMTIYNNDIYDQAMAFRELGAKYLHIVDLEGARDGATPNIGAIARAIQRSGLSAQVGGGIRSLDTIDRYIDIGAARVILGTAAANDPEFLSKAIELYGDKLAVGLDVKSGFIATHGWTQLSDETLPDALARLDSLGARAAIITDVSRDGMLGGANIGMYASALAHTNLQIIASGGVAGIGDITALRNLGVHGAIIGKAYYENRLNLREAIALCEEDDA
jgi:phosphoribosylformimino-5-aminoimidazole carboxamide ribotide isomerase